MKHILLVSTLFVMLLLSSCETTSKPNTSPVTETDTPIVETTEPVEAC